MVMKNKILIEKFIEIIPSKDLKMAYKNDICEGKYPNWDIDDIVSLFLYIYEWNIEKQIESLEEIIKYVKDKEKEEEINSWLNELKEKGSKYEFPKMPRNFYKYVVVKTLFKAGDLIKFPGNENKITYGIVGDFDYDKVFGDITDVCYYSHTLNYNIDRANPYKIYWSHNHPHKLETEKAVEDELDDELKDYAKFLREKIVYEDSEKMFDDYDKKNEAI